jgi:glycosyltransferase involved in cell wall biosynthesis
MRIAQVAPLIESVPPRTYGGTERVVSYLTEALVDQGHRVTLFASGDSITAATLVPMAERSLRAEADALGALLRHVMMVDRVFERASDFDVIHFHIDLLHYPLARRCATPCVTTLHGRLDLTGLDRLHEQFDEHPLVSISSAQRLPLPRANWCATVHHGLPEALYRFQARPQDYFAFVGRISPEKRVDRAIEVAIACDTRLRIGAKIDAVDRLYFDREIRPLLAHPLIEYVGEITEQEKVDFLGNARALLFPIDWPEPFGLAMIEALACGTPVIAYGRGSVPEVLQEGVTGRIVNDQAQAIEAARGIHAISRNTCREAFERRFTADRMARRYAEVYQSLIDARTPADGLPRINEVIPV